MKEKKINYGLIIFIIILIILFIPIISDYVKKQSIEVLSFSELEEKIENDESFVVYIGDLEKDIQKDLKVLRNLTKNDYSYDYNVYNVMKSDNIEKLLGEKSEVAIVIEGDIQKEYNKYDKDSLNKDVEKYLVVNLNDENISFNNDINFKNYKKIIKSDEVIMSVFGRDTCYYCNKFKPVYNAVAEKYELNNIYYFDSDSYDATDYKKIINLDLTVPAKCSSTGNEFKLSDGFGTPLTLFTKDGKVIDCISGYVNRSSLISTLKDVKMISE